jgi:hypothetical protein
MHKSSRWGLVSNQPINQPIFSHHIFTMKLTSTFISLAALFSVASADIEPVRFNDFYDCGATSLNDVACSNGPNGLVTKGFPTFGSLPSFPNIGGVYAVGAWNSPECGSCWELTYGGNTIYLTAIDTVGSGFDLSREAVNTLTNGLANSSQFSFVDAYSTQVDPSCCGL